jgi:hypothetical protein
MMRRLIPISALILSATYLAGCNTGAPAGVLPRTDIPPPPSLTGRDSRGGKIAASERGDVSTRRAVSVPSTLSTPPPPSNAVTPVMTGSGVGAGFKF